VKEHQVLLVLLLLQLGEVLLAVQIQHKVDLMDTLIATEHSRIMYKELINV
jgi:HD-like signal output (HDOD) protein